MRVRDLGVSVGPVRDWKQQQQSQPEAGPTASTTTGTLGNREFLRSRFPRLRVFRRSRNLCAL
jgi:hypothetical protein